MPPKVKTTGLNETVKELEKLLKNTDDIVEDVTRAGASVAADEMRTQIKLLRTDTGRQKEGTKRYARKVDVEGLLESLGYAPVQFDGTVADSNIGFDGYNRDKSKKYPNGHPNRMIANAINKGTSFMNAQPFINRTKRKAEKKCNAEMQKKLDEEIKKLTK